VLAPLSSIALPMLSSQSSRFAPAAPEHEIIVSQGPLHRTAQIYNKATVLWHTLQTLLP